MAPYFSTSSEIQNEQGMTVIKILLWHVQFQCPEIGFVK